MLHCLFLTSLLANAIPAVEWRQVAYDNAGVPDQQPHLTQSDGNARFGHPGTNDEALLTYVSGDRIVFAYSALNPHAAYKVKLRFFSDEPREIRIIAGADTIAPSLKIPAGKPTELELPLSLFSFASGRLTLVFEHVSDPKAVVSEITIFSTDPTPLGVIPDIDPIVPRLSPRPLAVDAVAQPVMDLAGAWRLNATADIQVPGEWVMQGFHLAPDQPAIYGRFFDLPADWHGHRVKLRCDAVFSDATVWINGSQAGHHQGGFTPFELDITPWVKPGQPNTIRLDVTNESIADTLASASKYAGHPLGGITRGIRLFALPALNVADQVLTTTFDHQFKNATLKIHLDVANESPAPIDAAVQFKLIDPDGNIVPIDPAHLLASLKAVVPMPAPDLDNPVTIPTLRTSRLRGDQVTALDLTIPVTAPRKWDPEHPHLYTLETQLHSPTHSETIRQRFGFRQVEVRGNQLFVNNHPVKLRGCTHHESYPTTGRTLPPGISRRDIELFREGNVNLLRTSHYPPDEALLDAADELGMFIECEAPFCWTKDPDGRQQQLVCRQTAEMVVAYRNHPSILFWSLANESKWGPYFIASSELVRQLDPSRPQTFNFPGDQKYTEIANDHYPGHYGPPKARAHPQHPFYQGEDSAVNVLNRVELATDPGLRDLWGQWHRELWDEIYATPGELGESIWAGVDDTFFIGKNQTVGYGAWGVLDGWRRPKPEYWNMKKAYSPVRFLYADPIELSGGGGGDGDGRNLQISVENRQLFSNLNEMKIAWKLGSQSGTATADIPPRAQGVLPIKLSAPPQTGDKLELTFTDPRGFVADQFSLPLPGFVPKPVAHPALANVQWHINQQTGQLESANQLPITGPQLMVLSLNYGGGWQIYGKTTDWEPFTAPCAHWVCTKGTTHANTTTVEGKYDYAEGSYTLTSQPDGTLEIAYAFTITKEVKPRQIGLVFTLPREYEVLSWERKGYWDVYPEDHIARLQGTVTASEGFPATSLGPRTSPTHPWRLDNLPYGNNDFCSTKHNVIYATLTNAAGQGIGIDARAQQHIRCWRTDHGVNILIADYSVGGIEPFIRTITKEDYPPLTPGQKITGAVRLQLCPSPPREKVAGTPAG